MRTEVLVSGCFAVVHAGHMQLLEFASRFGKVTVGINADNYLDTKYGDLAIPLVNRAYVLRNIRFVDKVVVFSESNPSQLIRKLKPRYYVKGPDYRGVELPEASACHEADTQVVIQPAEKIQNSSELLCKLSASAFSQIDLSEF